MIESDENSAIQKVVNMMTQIGLLKESTKSVAAVMRRKQESQLIGDVDSVLLLKSSSGSWFVVHAEANDDGTDGVVKKTPFDRFFDINDAGAKVYCTELIWHSAKIAGIYDFGSAVKIGGRDFITVDSIYHSPYLQESAAR